MRRDFGETYDALVADVYAFIAYRVGNRQDAEDLTQRTFERAFGSWDRFDPGQASERTWLVAIARNVVVDHYRSTTRPARRSLDEVHADAEPYANENYDLGVDPALGVALDHLNDRDREVVALRYGGDLTTDEIADTLGLSVANVQQILSRSLRRMRRELDPSHGERPTAQHAEAGQ